MAHDPEATVADIGTTNPGVDDNKKDTSTTNATAADEYLLDMVFVLDCTGSMASYINSARDNIVQISKELSNLSKPNENENENDNKDKNEKIENSKPDSNPKDANAASALPIESQIEGIVDTAAAAAIVVDKADEKVGSEVAAAPLVEQARQPKKKLSCKFAVVAYRDHPPQDSSFITEIRDFTGSSVMIEQYLKSLSASGGGDGPESLTTALYDTLHNLKYRDNSQRIIIIITDAPCHGIENTLESGDGFPNGDPWPQWSLSKKTGKKSKKPLFGVKTRSKESGHDSEYSKDNKKQMTDMLTIVRSITDDLEACFYAVACEPCLSTSYDYARDFMEAVAEMSNGKFVPLAKANLLPKVIIGSVKQQMMIDELTDEIDEEIEQLKIEYEKQGKIEQLTDDAIADFMEKKWESANLTYTEVAIGTLYRKERKRDNIEILLNRQECETLADFKKQCVKLERLKNSDFRHLKTKTKAKHGGKAPTFDDDESSGSASVSSSSESDCDSESDSDSDDIEMKKEKKPKKKKKMKRKKRSNKKEKEEERHRVVPTSMDSGATKAIAYSRDVRYGDHDNWSDSGSDSSQDVYEEVKPMDSVGTRKAVNRWKQKKSKRK